MSLLDDVKAKLATATPAQKFAFYIALPLLLLFVLFGGGGNILGDFIERMKRKNVDKQDASLRKDEQEAAEQAARVQSQIDSLDQKKKDEGQNAEKQDPVDFINDRFKPPGQ